MKVPTHDSSTGQFLDDHHLPPKRTKVVEESISTTNRPISPKTNSLDNPNSVVEVEKIDAQPGTSQAHKLDIEPSGSNNDSDQTVCTRTKLLIAWWSQQLPDDSKKYLSSLFKYNRHQIRYWCSNTYRWLKEIECDCLLKKMRLDRLLVDIDPNQEKQKLLKLSQSNRALEKLNGYLMYGVTYFYPSQTKRNIANRRAKKKIFLEKIIEEKLLDRYLVDIVSTGTPYDFICQMFRDEYDVLMVINDQFMVLRDQQCLEKLDGEQKQQINTRIGELRTQLSTSIDRLVELLKMMEIVK